MPVDTHMTTDHLRHSRCAEATSDAAKDSSDVGTVGEAADVADRPVEADVSVGDAATDEIPAGAAGRSSLLRGLLRSVLPYFAMILAAAAGYLAWQAGSARIAETSAETVVHAAMDSTVAILAYRPDSVEKDLTAATDNLTGKFRDEYTRLINEVVIPGSKEKHISSVVTVPAAAAMSATGSRAEVLVFVNQTILVGDDAPTFTASTVRVTLERIHDQWLISQFEPI